jgi:hypothetical protein
VRVLSVDDSAWRKKHRYGTMLTGLERSQVIDRLRVRSADRVVLQLKAEELVRSEIGKVTTGNLQVAAERTESHPLWRSVGICGFLYRTEMAKNFWSNAVWTTTT